MRHRASVIIHCGDEVLLIKRLKAGRRPYYVTPGGKIEAGESAEQAARREVWEELALKLPELIPLPDNPYPYKHTQLGNWLFYAVLTHRSSVTWQETHKQTADNSHQPVWIKLADLADLPTKPDDLAQLIK